VPNTPIQPTPLRVDKIGAILRAGICYNDIAISILAARLMGNSLGRISDARTWALCYSSRTVL